jgi:carbon starvation protein
MIIQIVALAMLVFLLAYRFYGRVLSDRLPLNDSRPTPACEINDGLDYVPAKPALLLGQHFSAIAAAGPIVGPILAGIWFGWLPALLWILFGAVLIGGVHDFASLVASIRHKATSIGEVVKEHMSHTSHLLFLVFVWLCLEYVIIAFTDITAQTFKSVQAGQAYGPGVAASSVLYLLASLVLGVLLYKVRMKLWLATAIFIPVVLGIVWAGPRLPAPVLDALNGLSVRQWNGILLAYCFVASILPVWLLLQPRGYLGGWLLYLTIGAGLVGAFFGGYTIQYPALNLTAGWASAVNGRMLFPVLFITVACGACSGFHGIVSSGTTAKQLAKESDARAVGYGGMLLEGLVAVLALGTVMILPVGSEMLKADPNTVYANGIAHSLGLVGIGFGVAFPFALLAFSTFVYDTLDVCTRLSRYVLQELFGLKGRLGAVIATGVSLLLPLIFLMVTKEKGYLVAWPIFGTSNQLLASLILLAVSVWMLRMGRSAWIALVPMAFMMTMTLWSLFLQVVPFVQAVRTGQGLKPDGWISGIVGVVLLVLSLWLIAESFYSLVVRRPGRKPVSRPGA